MGSQSHAQMSCLQVPRHRRSQLGYELVTHTVIVSRT